MPKDYASQLEYTGSGYLDAKIQPVANLGDLNRIPRSERFIGLTVTVLENGPKDYWLRKNISEWEEKSSKGEFFFDGDDILG